MYKFTQTVRSAFLAGAALALAPATFLAGSGASAQSFTTIVDPANPTFTQALGINNAGTVVGYGNANTFNGFELTLPSTFARQNAPGADGGTQVVGISGAGTTVGFSVTGGVTNGFVNNGGQGGTFTTVDQPGTAFNQVLGINQLGTVAAGYSSTDATGMTLQKAFTVSGGPLFASPVFTDINALLPANSNSQATGVNNAGTVVGFYQYAVGDFSAFVDIGGAITSFQFPGSISTQALGVNDLGNIVGDYLDPTSGNTYGFLDVNGMFTKLDPFSSLVVTANGINDNGRIVGFFGDANFSTIGFISSTVPEPSSWAMMLLGFAGLGFTFRQSRRREGRRHAEPFADVRA
jgi:PEP-CTERM motif